MKQKHSDYVSEYVCVCLYIYMYTYLCMHVYIYVWLYRTVILFCSTICLKWKQVEIL